MLIELEELNLIRLDEDRSYQQLADAIGLRNQSSLHRLLAGYCNPTDRTLHKIRRYLKARKLAAQAATSQATS